MGAIDGVRLSSDVSVKLIINFVGTRQTQNSESLSVSGSTSILYAAQEESSIFRDAVVHDAFVIRLRLGGTKMKLFQYGATF